MMKKITQVLLPTLLIGLFASGCDRRHARFEIECKDAVRLYGDLYINHQQDHRHPEFNRVLSVADRLGHRQEESCTVLSALADEINKERTTHPRFAAASFAPVDFSDSYGSGSSDWGARQVLAIILVFMGIMVSMVAGLWLLVMAFQENVLWGLVSIFVPFGQLAFIISRWERARDPFLVNMAGGGVAVLGFLSMM